MVLNMKGGIQKMRNTITLGCIIKHKNDGLGFKVTCPDQETANRYKDMFRWIILDAGLKVVYNHGYYDTYKDEERNEL